MMREAALASVSVFGLAACATSDATMHAVGPTSLPPSFVQAGMVPAANDADPAVEKRGGKYATSRWKNAAKVFEWEDDKIIPIRVACCGDLTVIQLPPGERHTGEKASHLGDADNEKWGMYATMAGNSEVISVGADIAGRKTKMVVTTTARAYIFALYSVPPNRDDSLVKISLESQKKAQKSQAEQKNYTVYDPAKLDASYSIELVDGDSPPWMPVSAFNIGGNKTWIEFPGKPGQIGAPVVLVSGYGSKTAIPVPMRSEANFYEVDTPFTTAELALAGSRVRISKARS